MNRLLLILLPLLLCGAASFNGSSQGASTSADIGTIGTNLLTVAFRVSFNTTNGCLLLESSENYNTAANTPAIAIGTAGVAGYVDASIHGSGALYFVRRTITQFDLNSWHSHVIVFDRQSSSTNQIRWYTNGVSAGLVQIGVSGNGGGTTVFKASERFYFGARGETSLRLSGFLQDVAIFAGEVSAAEAHMIGAQRMSPLKVRSAKLINYWPFSAGENASNSPDLVGGIPVNSGTKSIVLEQAPTYRK